MTRLKIGIDLDDVVFEFMPFLLKKYEEDFGKKINFEDVFSYYLENVWHLDFKETTDYISKVCPKEVFENLDLRIFSKEVILKLFNNNDIYFITSRVNRGGTLESLNKYFSDFKFELIFSSNPHARTKGKTKGEICVELGIDYMIEDNTEHSVICADKGIKTILLERPWNKDAPKNDNIIQVKDWRNVLEIIENGN